MTSYYCRRQQHQSCADWWPRSVGQCDCACHGPTDEQVQALVDACPQAAMFHETPLHGLHALRRRTFWEDATQGLIDYLTDPDQVIR